MQLTRLVISRMVVRRGGRGPINHSCGEFVFFLEQNVFHSLQVYLHSHTQKHHNLNTIPSNSLGLASHVDILGDSSQDPFPRGRNV